MIGNLLNVIHNQSSITSVLKFNTLYSYKLKIENEHVVVILIQPNSVGINSTVFLFYAANRQI